MAEEPEQVLVIDGARKPGVDVTAVPIDVEQDHRNQQHRKRRHDHQHADQRGPGEHRHPQQRHAGRPPAGDRRDHARRHHEHPGRGQDHADDPQVLSDPGGVGAVGQRCVGRPAGPSGATGGEPALLHNEAAAQPRPQAGQAQPRSREARRPDLQRHQVQRHRDRHRRHEQVDHGRAVHRKQLVVGVVRDELHVRLRQLRAHQQREHPAEQEEEQRAHAEREPHAFVVGAGDGAEPAGHARDPSSGCGRDAHGVGPVPLLFAHAANCAGVDRVGGEDHVGVTQPAELRALPGEHAPGERRAWLPGPSPGSRRACSAAPGSRTNGSRQREVMLKRTASPAGTTSGRRPTVPLCALNRYAG